MSFYTNESSLSGRALCTRGAGAAVGAKLAAPSALKGSGPTQLPFDNF